MNKEFRLKTKEGDYLNIFAYSLENIRNAPCLILVHGFKGFQNWGFFPFSAEYFAKSGYFVITFDFSHNGIDGSGSDFFETDKFAANTISLEVSELVQLIEAYKKGFFGIQTDGRIGLIGHSRGGGVAVLSSMFEKADAYVLWAAVARFDRYTEHQKSEWKKKGYLEVLNSRTGQMMRLNVGLLEDIESNKDDSLNLKKALENLDKNLLIIHGTEDLTVPAAEGELIYSWGNKSLTEFAKIAGSGHTFDIVHPFTVSNKKFDEVLEKTKQFFDYILISN